MELKTLISECTAYDFKVMLEEKKPKSWLKSVGAFANAMAQLDYMVKRGSGLTRICNETKALDDIRTN